jgi:SNF2 family DNA or RNA helicase
MSDELNELDQIEKELQEARRQAEENNRRLEELLRKQQAAKLEQEKTKEVILTVKGNIIDGKISIKTNGRPRDDVLVELRKTRSRFYSPANEENVIHVADWADLLKRLSNLPRITVDIPNGFEEEIERYLNAPSFDIDIDHNKKLLTIKTGPNARLGLIYNIECYSYDASKKLFTLPLTEAWRLAESLADLNNEQVEKQYDIKQIATWSVEAEKYVTEQLERRSLVDKIAKMSDEELENYEPTKFVDSNWKWRPYQKRGVKFMEATDFQMLLADDVGLGKTPQSVAAALITGDKTLVIVPGMAVDNWSKKIEQYTGKTPIILSGTLQTTGEIKHAAEMLLAPPNPTQFYIINYEVINRKQEAKVDSTDNEGRKIRQEIEIWPWVKLISMANFGMIIVDEIHKIKDDSSQRSIAVRKLTAPHRIGLSATPVMNRPGEFHPALQWLRPDLIPGKEVYLRQYTIDGKRPKNSAELHKITKQIVLRRTKPEVMPELPPINRIYDYHTLSPMARELYTQALEGVYKVIDEAGELYEKDIPNILVQIMRCKQICAADKINRVADKAVAIYDGSEGNTTHRKVLIFSQFVTSPPIVKEIWKRLQPESLFITGEQHPKVSDKMAEVAKFQTDPNIHYLVASTAAASESLDITAAGSTIFVDLMWTPMAHHQAEGRAYGRMNDPHPIDSYYVIAKDTIDEWIWELLNSKLAMFGEVVDAAEAARGDESIVKDLIKRIKQSMWRK